MDRSASFPSAPRLPSKGHRSPSFPICYSHISASPFSARVLEFMPESQEVLAPELDDGPESEELLAPDSLPSDSETMVPDSLPSGAFICGRCDLVHEDRESWNRAHSRLWPCARCGLVHLDYWMSSKIRSIDEFDCAAALDVKHEMEEGEQQDGGR